MDVKVQGRTQTFTLKAVSGGKATLNGRDTNGADVVAPLTVIVGQFAKHPGMEIDLIADACRGSDPAKIHELHRLLNNNFENLFNENTGANVAQWGELACGTVAKVGGIKLFSPKTNYDYQTYHKPLKKVTSRDDVQYDPKMLRKARQAILGRLMGGVPVIIGVVYAPSTMMLSQGQLQPTRAGGHTPLVVGADKDGWTFLYIDPYPRASRLKYGGGMAIDPFTETCDHLGIFQFDLWERRGGVLRQRPDTQGQPGDLTFGTQFIEVISGPLR
jgi:hypothetical protein